MDGDDSKIFPQRLMECLSDPSAQDAIGWLHHGRAFAIHNRKLFAETVMPRYFSRKAKFSSFTRKLNRWNFARVASGPELGAYHHEFFLRDKPHLAAQMFCKNMRTMLALAKEEPHDAPHPTDEEIYTPISLQQDTEVQPNLLEFAPKFFSEDEQTKPCGFPMMSYGGGGSLQMLEQQMHGLLEQPQHYQAMPYNGNIPYQREQFLQMQQIMQLGMQQQRTRKPTDNRAHAA